MAKKKKVTKKTVTKKSPPKKASKKTSKKVASKKMSSLKEGDKAPDFTLLNQNGEKVSLKDFRGQNVVVYFYPKALTPGCTVQACGLRDAEKELKDLNVVVLGISPDPVKKLKNFEEKKDLNFTLLSDEDHKVAEAYHSWGLKKFMGREFMGVLRQSFFIDEKGKILSVLSKVETKSHHDTVVEFFKNR